MHPEVVPVRAAAQRLSERFGAPPPIAIVLGSGLGAVVDRMRVDGRASFGELLLPESTVHGHAGEVVVGSLGGTSVLAQSGRVHLYEGHSPNTVVRAVRAYAEWGVERLLLTASVGGIAEGLFPGSVVVVSDHINLQGDNPLAGPSWNDIRFPDLTMAHDARMRRVLVEAGDEVDADVTEGVYLAVKGPAYETPAEIRMMKIMGADVVGMSTVPEVVAAAQMGLPVAALAVVSNLAAGLTGEPLSHDDVTESAGLVANQVADLIEVAVGRF